MKKYWLFAALGSLLFLAAPALAIQADFSGEYYVQGNYNDNLSLLDDGGTSDAYLEMRLRLKAVFEINKNVSLTTRLDGPGQTLGGFG